MTYNLGGDKVQKQKIINVMPNLYDIPLQIEEELCRQINKGIWKDEVAEVKIILKFIERSKK